jgi:histone deacetylase 1/2
MDNANTKEYLDKIRVQVVENLKRTSFAPSVQMTDVPRDPLVEGMDDEADAILDDMDEDDNKDKRYTQRRFDQYVEKSGELSDSEDEDENAANGVRRQPGVLKRRNQVNYRNLDVDSGLDSGVATPVDASSVPDDDMDTTADAKMGEEAPRTETEGPATPSVAEPPSRAEEASATEQTEMAIDEQEQAVPSAPISRQASPKAHDEDTTMEDVNETAPEPEKPEHSAAPSERAEVQKPTEETPATDKPATELSSPAKAQSPPKESTGEQGTVEADEVVKIEETTENKDKNPEASKGEPESTKVEQESTKDIQEPTTEPQEKEPTKSEA